MLTTVPLRLELFPHLLRSVSERFLADGALVEDTQKAVYIYAQQMGGHIQYGPLTSHKLATGGHGPS